jgi:predicted nucleic acid-binding protein
MSGWLLDTNVLSELRKGRRCDPGVSQWFATTEDMDLFTSVLVLGEIRKGVERIRTTDPSQAEALEQWLQRTSEAYADRILPVDEIVADQWGRLGVCQPLPVLDALLAATALCHDLTLVSRDTRGFRTTGLRLLNPFSK